VYTFWRQTDKRTDGQHRYVKALQHTQLKHYFAPTSRVVISQDELGDSQSFEKACPERRHDSSMSKGTMVEPRIKKTYGKRLTRCFIRSSSHVRIKIGTRTTERL